MAGIRSGSSPPRDHDVATFDCRAGSYERDWRSEFHTRVVATAVEVALAALPHPVAVLDMGCGTGALLRTLADRLPAGGALASVDPAPAMLEVGRPALGRRSRVWLARAIAERLPFRDASFDLVVTTVSFAHWADQPAGLTEIARVLRPAGRPACADRPVRIRLAAPTHRPRTAARPGPYPRRAGGHAQPSAAGATRLAARLRPRPPPWSAPSSPATGFNRLQLAGSGDCRWPAATTGAGREDRRPIQRNPPGVNESGNAPPTRESATGRRGSAGGPATHPSPAAIAGHPPMWLAGRVVAGRYRLRRPLGRGGMGMVWLAVDQVLRRPVAVKQVLLGAGESNQERLEAWRRLRHEARLAALVGHPGTVRVFDLAEEAGDPWIVMEALPGRTLDATLGDRGPLPVGQVTGIGLRLLETLETIHRAGIVHRDVKPGNVQLCGSRRVVLTDFGIAAPVGHASARGGAIVGSPAYMAPELVHGDRVEPASDLFSLGATLYAAVEGRSPFGKGCPTATLTAVVTDPPAPSRRAGPLGPVIEGLLVKDPRRRLGYDQTRSALRAVQGQHPRRS